MAKTVFYGKKPDPECQAAHEWIMVRSGNSDIMPGDRGVFTECIKKESNG